MGYAKYVGRVGALAVTLGVGVAVATMPGIAYADPSEGSGDSASSSTEKAGAANADPSSVTGAAGGGAPGAGSAQDRESTPGAANAPAADDGTEVEADDAGEVDDVTEVGDAGEVDDGAEVDDAGEVGDGAGVDDADDQYEAVEGTNVEAEADTTDTAVDLEPGELQPGELQPGDLEPGDSLLDPVSDDPTNDDEVTSGSDDGPSVAEPGVADTVGTMSLDADESDSEATAFSTALVADATGRRSSAPAAAAGVTTVVPTPVAPTQPKTLIGVVTEFVGSVLQSLLNPGSGSPMQIPILTAVLSFVRTELERFFFPRNANAAPQQTVTLITDPPSAAVDPTQQHVLVIGVDGTNLSRILADDYNQNFIELIGTSTTAASSIVGHTTISNPSWTSILTGFWGERTGVINNVFTPWTYEKYTTVFNQLETLNRDIDTMAVADWDVINAIAGAGSLYADDNRYVPQVDGDTNWLATDDRVAAVTIDALAGDDAPNFLFSYYVGVDENGHMYGGDSLEYKLAIRNMDDNLGDILDAVDVWEAAHPGEEWTIIVVTDHGHQPQQGFGHGFQSPDETATFVIADGPDFKDGYVNSRYQIVDVTPTVVSLFGGTPVSGSDGVPLTTLAGGDEHPDDLKSALQAEIAKNKSPDFLTDAALTLRTIFSTVPYYVYTFGNDLTAGLPSFLQLPVKLLFDGLYVATNVPAQIVAFLTGVSGARIFPLLPPAPPNFPPEDATLLESRVPVCGLGSTSAAEPSCTAEVLV